MSFPRRKCVRKWALFSQRFLQLQCIHKVKLDFAAIYIDSLRFCIKIKALRALLIAQYKIEI